MPHQNIYNNFLGGLDADSQDLFVKNTDWRSALNIRAGVAYAGRMGAITNLKGNTEVAYQLPSGTNKCIGAYEDKQENTVIYFIYNSNGNHQILRYYPEAGRIDLQLEYEFAWTADTEITGVSLVNGRLLYWLDPKPHKVNIEKSRLILPDGSGKKKSWQIILGQTNTGQDFFQVVVKSMNGTNLASINATVNSGSVEEKLKSLAAQINAGLSTYLTAEACDCHINVEEVQENVCYPIIPINQYMVVPMNWYGLTLTERMFDRSKWMPMFEPIATYLQDDVFGYNYVRNKVFQFRLKYRYDDFENSVLGVISQIPITNLQCDGTNAPEKNYIKVEFNDPDILAAQDVTLIKDVSVLVREGNDGAWREVIQLRPCDFLDYDNGTEEWSAYYNFYNNIVSNTVADDDVRRQYDDVPHTAEDDLIVKNRSIMANVVKGYDAPDCADAKWSVDVADTRSPKLHKIIGIVRIFNPFMDNSADIPAETVEPNILERRSPILYDTAYEVDGVGYPFFGGTFYDSGSVTIKNDWAYELKRQIIPEGGFTAYCAGHKYFGISKQISRNNVSQRSDGSIESSTAPQKQQVENLLEAFSADPTDEQYDLSSTFEILVPDGEYVIRLASHWCSFGDKLGKGFMYDLSAGLDYQRTSTNVWGVNDSAIGGSYRYDYEIKVTVSGADVFIGEFLVADMCIPIEGNTGSVRQSFSGYLFDANGLTDAISLSQGVTAELSLVRNSIWTVNSKYTDYLQKKADHNGYFYNSAYDFNTFIAVPNRFFAYQVGGQIRSGTVQYYEDPTGKSALDLLYSQTITASYPTSPVPSHLEIILPTDTPNARARSSTFVVGTVYDTNGLVLSNTLVLFTHGKYEKTDTNGSYSIIAWGNYFAPLSNARQDYALFSLDYSCQPSYPNGQTEFCNIVPYGASPTDYNPNNPFQVADFIIDEGNNPTQKAHKRGGQYIYSLRYYDDAGRFCSVVPAFSMYIPFITEDLNILCQQDKYYDVAQYPTGTYKYGKPTVNWYLDANFKPPTWAAYYQWMRTKNSIYGRYLQWNANSVTYLSAVETDTTPEIQTSFQNSDATAIKIQLTNIVDYSAQNPTSQIGYTFEQGDRVRIIADREIEYDSGLNDYEVVNYDEATQSIIIKNENSSVEIKSGSFIELMNVKSITDPQEQIFYEVGEVYTCTEPNSPNNEHSVLNGTFTNGDTYWRGRFVPVNDDATNYSAVYPVVVEDAAVSDFYPSTSQDIGRAGVVDVNFKQIHYPTMMQNSGIYVEGSAINGLSSFSTADYKELNRAFGAIKRLFYVGNTLISLHENKVVANYIELRSLSDANTTDGLLAISDAYFGNDRPLQSEYGCQHGKSAVQWNGLVYFLDAAKGVVCRYDNNGMDAISDKGMRSYFRELCRDGVNNVRAVFDPYYRQYVITVYGASADKTVAWDEEKNRWTSEYSFLGEDYASVLRSIVSFKDGKLWLHDSNAIHNNFYGVQHTSQAKIVVVSGANRSTYHTVTLQAVQQNPLENDWQIVGITNEFNQQSRLKKPHFRLKENVWAASFMRDTTDTTVTNPIVNGRNLRSQTLTMNFDNDSTDAVYLQTVTTKVLPSPRQ